MAKGHDNEIVRTLETHLKDEPWKIERQLCVVTGLQV